MSFHVRAINPQLSASVDRLINGILTEGILTPADSFLVREQAAQDMSVRVGSGVAGDRIVIEASSTFEDPYIGRLPDATQTVLIAVGDPSNDRIDLVIARVYDDEVDSSGTTDGVIEVVEGTPASTPAAPAVPDGAIALAEVRVTVGESTSIVSGDITDRRVECQVRGSGADAVADADLVPFAHMRDYVEQVRPHAEIARANSQSIAAGQSETITWDTPTSDDHGWWTAGDPTKITPDQPGRYQVALWVDASQNWTGDRMRIVILLNGAGTRWEYDGDGPTAAHGRTMQVVGELDLDGVSDWVGAAVLNGHTVERTVTARIVPRRVSS